MNGRAIAFAAAVTALAALACGAGACAAGALQRGKVMMNVDEHESRIRFSSDNFREGDTIQFLRDKCGTRTKGSVSPNCRLQPVGRGVVTRIIQPNEAAVQPDPGVTIKLGDEVEKIPQ